MKVRPLALWDSFIVFVALASSVPSLAFALLAWIDGRSWQAALAGVCGFYLAFWAALRIAERST